MKGAVFVSVCRRQVTVRLRHPAVCLLHLTMRLRWRAGGFRVRVAAGGRWQTGGIPENGIFVCPGAYFSYLWKVKAGKQEKKESKFVKTKIVTGYVVLVVVCILAVGYAYRAMIHIAAPGENYALLQVKRRAVNQTLYHLYQAESYGQLMIAGYQSYEERYHRELRTVRACIDSLRGLSDDTDSLQTLRLDSIVRLIDDKERRTMSLRRSIRSAGTASLLDKNIRQLLEGDDSLGGADTSLVLRSVVLSDTVSVPRSKRRGWRGAVFPAAGRSVQPAAGGFEHRHLPARIRRCGLAAGGQGYDRSGAAGPAGQRHE